MIERLERMGKGVAESKEKEIRGGKPNSSNAPGSSLDATA